MQVIALHSVGGDFRGNAQVFHSHNNFDSYCFIAWMEGVGERFRPTGVWASFRLQAPAQMGRAKFARLICSAGSSAELFPGVQETPRRTSPKPAVLSVTKLSLAGRVVARKVSVIATSLFGSAPWSPLPLMVEVMA